CAATRATRTPIGPAASRPRAEASDLQGSTGGEPGPAVDPDVAKVLLAASRSRAPSYQAIRPQAARALYERTAPILDVAPAPLALADDWTVEDGLERRDGVPLRVRRYCPAEPSWADLRPALLYFHGGGFLTGSLAPQHPLCRRLAALSDCFVVSVDYRLAPEHRLPAAVDDAFDALDWLRREAPSLGIDPDRLAVGGDSAGGTLAAACALLARDRGWPACAAATALSRPGGHAADPLAPGLRERLPAGCGPDPVVLLALPARPRRSPGLAFRAAGASGPQGRRAGLDGARGARPAGGR